MNTIKLGDIVEFKPLIGIALAGFRPTNDTAVGTVTYINEEHQWFSVEYELAETHQRTSFKFADIGEYVKVRR